MSIVPITKIQTLFFKDDVEKALKIAQEVGAVEFKEIKKPVTNFEQSVIFDSKEAKSAGLLLKISHTLNFLSHYEPKVSTLTKLMKGSTISVKESDLKNGLPTEVELNPILEQVSNLEFVLNENKEQLKIRSEQRTALLPWQGISVPLNSLKTNYTNTYLVHVVKISDKSKLDLPFSSRLEAALNKAGIEFYIEENGEFFFSLTTFGHDYDVEVTNIIKAMGGEVVNLEEGENTPTEEIKALDIQIQILENKIAEIEKDILVFSAKNLETIRLAHDAYVWTVDREQVLNVAKTSNYFILFEGWCNEKNLPALKVKLTENNILYTIEEIPLAEDEEVPVEIENNSLIRPFEIVTRLNGLPGNKDLDPTPFMAAFFFLFFGLSLTDVGYGFFLMVVASMIIFLFKVAPMVKLFGKLLFLMGLGSFTVGMVFGGYLGIDMANMPKFLQSIQKFDPIGNPLPVFYLALSLGVLQVMTGMVLKIVTEAKNNRLVTGLLDQGPWLVLFTALILYGLSANNLIAANSESLLMLIYVAVGAVVLASGRTGTTLMGKIQNSLLSIYSSIGYLSDILSYSRLLALGLATSALAFAVNLIAGIVGDMVPYVGFVFAGIILIVGHLFTLVINTLGSFIHSSRLQFVEFFGKFITGTGKEFKPLTRKESYVNVVKDSG